LRLKPAKIEVISVEPEIQIIYEAVKDREIEDIIKRARPMVRILYIMMKPFLLNYYYLSIIIFLRSMFIDKFQLINI